jgi:hypothetical protein
MAAAGAVRPEVVADFIVLAGSPLDDIANARRIERIVHRGRPRVSRGGARPLVVGW